MQKPAARSAGSYMNRSWGVYHNQGKQVLNHLDERGIDSLDYLVATHDDADHIGGHAAIVEKFGSQANWCSDGPKCLFSIVSHITVFHHNPPKTEDSSNTAPSEDESEDKDRSWSRSR